MAKQSNRALFSGLGETVETAEEQPVSRRRTEGYLSERDSQLAKLTRGDIVEKALYWVDPERCRMWVHHNRRYELLNEERCADLVQSIRAQGRQEFPAIVRRVEEGSDFDYEVICGARRHWSISWLRENNYPQFKFLVEVRDLSDEEAFRLSDAENRDREDISDYERAVDYRDAMKRYYRTQKEMAARLEVSEAWLTQYLDLAQLPKEVVAAFPDVTAIRVQHSRTLKPLLKDRKLRQRVLEKAKAVKAKQDTRRKEGTPLEEGRAVVRELSAIRGAQSKEAKAPKAPLAMYESAAGNPMLEVNKRGQSLVLTARLRSGATKEEVTEACLQAIDQYYG